MTRTAPAGGSLDRQRAPRTAAWPLSPSEPRPPPPAPRPGAPGLQAWAADPSTSVTPWVAVSSQPRAADPPERGPLEDRSQSRCPEPAGVPARAPGGRARLLGLCAVPEGPPRPPSCPGSGPGACPHHLLAVLGACRLSCSVRGHIPSDWHPRGTQPPGPGDVESRPTHWVTPSTGGRSRGLVLSTPGRPSLAAPTCSEPTSHSARRWAWERWTVNQRDPGQPLGSASSLLPGLAARIPAAPQGPRGAAGRLPEDGLGAVSAGGRVTPQPAPASDRPGGRCAPQSSVGRGSWPRAPVSTQWPGTS